MIIFNFDSTKVMEIQGEYASPWFDIKKAGVLDDDVKLLIHKFFYDINQMNPSTYTDWRHPKYGELDYETFDKNMLLRMVASKRFEVYKKQKELEELEKNIY